MKRSHVVWRVGLLAAVALAPLAVNSAQVSTVRPLSDNPQVEVLNVDPFQRAARAGEVRQYHEGHLILVAGERVAMAAADNERHTFKVSEDALILLQGSEVPLGRLRPGQLATVIAVADPDGTQVARVIDAKLPL